MDKPFLIHNTLTHIINKTITTIKIKRRWLKEADSLAKNISKDKLPFSIYKHQLKLIDSTKIEHNQIQNINLALNKINGIIIKPNETFSFCYLIGKPTARKGYKKGLVTKDGKQITSTDAGLHQLASLINWLCLHSPLTITNYHFNHNPYKNIDGPFPFGYNLSIDYNYNDFEFKNETNKTFQLIFSIDDFTLNAELKTDKKPATTYDVYERNHFFIKKDAKYYQTNELWHLITDGKVNPVRNLITRNVRAVNYNPPDYIDYKFIKYKVEIPK